MPDRPEELGGAWVAADVDVDVDAGTAAFVATIISLLLVVVVFFKRGAEKEAVGVTWAALGGDGCVVSFFTTCFPLLEDEVGAEVGGCGAGSCELSM